MAETTEQCLIPKELEIELMIATYALWKKGAPVKEAIKTGKRIVLGYWEKKNADKGGG